VSSSTASRLVELDWSLCAWCGKDFERPELLHEVVSPLPARQALPEAETEGLQEVPPAAPLPQLSTSSLDTRVTERAPRHPRAAAGEN
jgi:hypothetical protein